MGGDFVMLSFTPMLIGALAAIACALPGNFLLLRRQALIGDAMSHVVLPGIVAGFLVAGQISTWSMLLGAAAAALVAVALIEVVRRVGRVEPGAAMGVVFTAMFALGVLLIEQSDTSGVHLDVEHALYGNLESLIWLEGAAGWSALADPAALAYLPPELFRVAGAAALAAVFTWLFWRPLVLATFDEGYAAARGLRVRLISLGLIVLAALAAVTAFDAVGSILVIAMFICPPAAARLITDSLPRQVGLSVVFAAGAAMLGYVLAGYGPLWLGHPHSVSAAGMIATLSGALLGLAAWSASRRGRSQHGAEIPATGARPPRARARNTE
jgi:manganese/zinc/iron transport system permease protein